MKLFKKVVILCVFLGMCLPAFGQTNGEETTPDPVEPGTRTDGPEGSEITPSDASDFKRFGVGLILGQTLLSGDEADRDTGFNNTLSGGVVGHYRFKKHLTTSVKYWSSQHDSIKDGQGNLTRSNLTGELRYYSARGVFAPYGLVGAGLYFADFDPSSEQEAAGVDSSSVSTFGVLLGGGVDFEVAKSFVLGLDAVWNHSFARRNSDREVKEAEPFLTVGLNFNVYF